MMMMMMMMMMTTTCVGYTNEIATKMRLIETSSTVTQIMLDNETAYSL